MPTLPRHYFMGSIIFVMLIIGVMSLVTEVETGGVSGTQQGVTGFSDPDTLEKFNKAFNKKEEVTNATLELKSDLQDLKVTNIIEGVTLPVALINTAWDLVRYVISNFTLLDSAIEGITAFIGVPSWVTSMILLLIVLFFVFSILSIIFGKDI